MNVLNIHSKIYPRPVADVGALIDTLSAKSDQLWPVKLWPRMRFDKPLSLTATGGHGPIGYVVEEYLPGKRVVFRFNRPRGFHGVHGYEVFDLGDGQSELRQTLEMTTDGWARLSWPLFYRPLHDALIEDSLSFAELRLGLTPVVEPWSAWVRLLRWLISFGKGRPQRIS